MMASNCVQKAHGGPCQCEVRVCSLWQQGLFNVKTCFICSGLGNGLPEGLGLNLQSTGGETGG